MSSKPPDAVSSPASPSVPGAPEEGVVEVRSEAASGSSQPASSLKMPKTTEVSSGTADKKETKDGGQAKASDIQAFLLKQQSTAFSFSQDKELKIPVTKLVNTSTKQVVWQVPPEELLATARKLRNEGRATGQVIDQQI